MTPRNVLALGVALLAGAGVGRWKVPGDVERSGRLDRVFGPQTDEETRAALPDGWQSAVRHVRAAAADHRPEHPTPERTAS